MKGMMDGKQRPNAAIKGMSHLLHCLCHPWRGSDRAVQIQNCWDYAIGLHAAKVSTGITDITRVYGYRKPKKQKSKVFAEFRHAVLLWGYFSESKTLSPVAMFLQNLRVLQDTGKLVNAQMNEKIPKPKALRAGLTNPHLNRSVGPLFL